MSSLVSIGIMAFALVVAWVIWPPFTPSGGVSELTFAYATADAPSGIYYERDFDWPTGEAVWVDVPAFSVHVCLIFLTLVGILHYSVNRVPRIPGHG